MIRILQILAVAIVYLITAKLGLLLALQPGYATAVWPPSGIAVAALLLLAFPIWPGIFIGSFIANFLNAETSIIGFIVSNGIALGSTLQAVAIAYLLKTLTTSVPYLLHTRKNILSFLIFTLFCCTISSTLSLVTLFATGVVSLPLLIPNWFTWWLGDTVGVYLFTPFIFSWSQVKLTEIASRKWELISISLLTLTVGWLCFGRLSYPVEYMLLPCLIWAALRFPSQIPTAILVVIAFIANLGTTYLNGPFIRPMLNESLLLLQAFIGVLSATTLILIAAMNEIRHDEEVLEEYAEELKDQVKALRK